MVQTVNMLAQLHQLSEFQRFLPVTIGEHNIRRATQAERTMRQGVPNVLDKCVLATPRAASTVNVPEGAEGRSLRDVVEATLKVLAPHVTKGRKRHEDHRRPYS